MTEEADSKALQKGEQNPWVLYLIVNNSLNMGTGKIAAQVGHAVDIIRDEIDNLKSISIKYQKTDKTILSQAEIDKFEVANRKYNNYLLWRQVGRRKVVLTADAKEFEKLKAEECFIVHDAGLTQVSAGSETVISLLPMRKNDAPKIIKRLQVLK